MLNYQRVTGYIVCIRRFLGSERFPVSISSILSHLTSHHVPVFRVAFPNGKSTGAWVIYYIWVISIYHLISSCFISSVGRIWDINTCMIHIHMYIYIYIIPVEFFVTKSEASGPLQNGFWLPFCAKFWPWVLPSCKWTPPWYRNFALEVRVCYPPVPTILSESGGLINNHYKLDGFKA